MLKITTTGRRRQDSFNLLDHSDGSLPKTPAPTPSSSFVPSPFIEQCFTENAIMQAAESILLTPTMPAIESIQDKRKVEDLKKMMVDFYLSDEQLKHIEKRMVTEINWGLGKTTNPTSNIKSYITYVSDLPTGREHGQFLALDLGGTNFRAILIELEAGTASNKMKAAKHTVSQEIMQGPGVNLFNFMADKLREFMIDHELMGQRYKLGFTFSFATMQHSLKSADLACWTKGYVCEGVEGEDVGKLLEAAISRHKDMDIEVCAILNDTTGCLLACAYKRPDCALGVIIGTGTNASYVEDISNVEMYESDPGRKKQVVINTEWGALGNTGSLDFVRTKFDHAVDKNSKNPGKQVYEKLISGMYLGELTRHILLDATKQKILFNGDNRKTELLETRELFQTRHISEIETDEVGETDNINQVLVELGIDLEATPLDYQVVRYICECVSVRASVLAAAGVAALLNKINRKRVTVGMDGSLYKFHPHFHNRMVAKISSMIDSSIQFQMVLSEDGSGRGAGLAAAVSSNKR